MGSGDLACPGPAFSEAEPQPAAAADDPSGDGEIRSRIRLGSPPAGGAVKGEHLHPGQQLAGQCDDLAPDLVLLKAVQRQVTQPGVLGIAVLAPLPDYEKASIR